MKLGDRGLEVVKVQRFLVKEGFLAPSSDGDKLSPPEPVYGVKTKKAVIELQKKLGIEPTGIWDDSIYAIYKNKTSSTESSGSSSNNGSKEPSGSSSKDSSTETKTPSFKSEQGPKGRWFDQNKEIECYIINRLTGTKIIFGISPEEVTESVSAQFDEADVRGRSSPFKQYSQSGPKTVSFTISLYADYCPMGIVQTVSAIKALVYPQYSDVIEAPHSYFKIGKFIAIDGIVSSVSVTWKKPFRDGYYLFADVSIDMDEVRSIAQSAKEVESSG